MDTIPQISEIKYTLGNTLIETFRTDNTIFNIIIAMIIGRIMLLIIGMLERIPQFIHKLWNSLFHRFITLPTPKPEFASSLSFCETQEAFSSNLIRPIQNSSSYNIKCIQSYICRHSLEYDTGHFILADSKFVTKSGIELYDLGQYCVKHNQLLRIADDIWIYVTRTNEKINDSMVEQTLTVTLSSYQPITHIKQFITICRQEYSKILEENDNYDQKKYFLLYERRGNHSPLSKSELEFSSHVLNNQKIFDHLFFPEREQIIEMIKHFMHRTGIFAKPFVPHKLGFLLYGVPGCGKTGFIKSLANMTQRHIVSVPIEEFRSDLELLHFFNTLQISHSKGDPIINASNCIFVIEEIDVLHEYLQERGQSYQKIESDDVVLEKTSDVPHGPSKLPKQNVNMTDWIRLRGYDSDLDNPMYNLAAHRRTSRNHLTLRGFLEVLDGVLDTPGRIIVITSNHPEKLDQALFRPGRINRKIYFDRMTRGCTIQFLEMFYGITLPTNLSESILDRQFTPSYIEQLCIESPGIDEVLEKLRICEKSP